MTIDNVNNVGYIKTILNTWRIMIYASLLITAALILLVYAPTISRKIRLRNHHSHTQKRVRGSFAKAKENSIKDVRFIKVSDRTLRRK